MRIRIRKQIRVLGICAVFCLLMACQQTEETAQDVRVTQEQMMSEEEVEEKQLSELVANPTLPEPLQNTYDTLNVATYITKIDELFFLVDCYHNQILYHDNLTDDISQWQVLTREVNYAHTIAGDGEVLLVDDTDHNRVLVFEKTRDGYLHTQTFEEIGMKPHFVQYDEKRQCFYVWSSITGEMYLMKREEDTNRMYIDDVLSIPELFGVYVRSFTIIGDDIYFVSGHNNEMIIQANADTLAIKETYPVADQIAGMVQLVKIQDYFYITVSTDNEENQDFATMIRTKDLHTLEAGEYEDVYQQLGISGGTPYYITQIDERYYLTHHRTNENVIAFEVRNNILENIEVLY